MWKAPALVLVFLSVVIIVVHAMTAGT